MRYESLVGLFVTNDDLYKQYREEMIPILKTYGGGFGYDFIVSTVLKSEVETPINRVFTIYFKNEIDMNAFFSNEDYLEIKRKIFEKSVSSTTIISQYVKNEDSLDTSR